jgi:arginyl-tRNA synthetase
LQYAFARIRSIFRKGGLEGTTGMPAKGLQISEPQERALARHLFNFGLTLEGVAQEYRPNFLCNYLYELAGHFTTFYEKCPVLKAEADVRASRLVLCDLTAQVLREGLTILGIETLEQM